jgi:tRNA-dihydrouridine synthase A
MLGREAYHRPLILAELESALHGSEPVTREAMLERMTRYAEREVARGERLSSITRHMLGLFNGEPGARTYRRILSEGARAPEAAPALILQAGQRASTQQRVASA